MEKDRKKKYTVKEVTRIVDKLEGGKNIYDIETSKLKQIYNKLEDKIYHYSDNDAQTYLSDYILLEIESILKKRDKW